MANINTFKDLVVWQRAHKLVLLVYKVIEKLPDNEKFGLVSQMRRVVVSVSSNVVEGFYRKTSKESLRFYNIANASLEELKYQLLICHDLNFLKSDIYIQVLDKCNLVGGSLMNWIKSQKDNANI